MRAATESVGLVSPRSTWLSIGAETPERSARSRSERSIASRRARTRGPIRTGWSRASAVAIGRRTVSRTSVIAYGAWRTVAASMSGTFTAPDVLVLGAGGVLGEAWTNGVLAGLEDATGVDLRQVEAYVGTSAGSIVSARLAAGHRPRRPGASQAAEAIDERAGAEGDGVAGGGDARGRRAAAGPPCRAPAPPAPWARAPRAARAAWPGPSRRR